MGGWSTRLLKMFIFNNGAIDLSIFLAILGQNSVRGMLL